MTITTERQALDIPYGSFVRVIPRRGKTYTGQLTLCWCCVDEPALTVRRTNGDVETCFPLMGDKVEVISLSERSGK